MSSTKLLWQGAIAFPLGKDVAVLTKINLAILVQFEGTVQ